MGSRRARYSRVRASEDESEFQLADSLSDTNAELGDGREHVHDDVEYGPEEAILRSSALSPYHPKSHGPRDGTSRSRSKWTRRKRLLTWGLCGRNSRDSMGDNVDCRGRHKARRPFRFLLRCLAASFMLLGVLEFGVLVAGFIGSLFPEDFESAYARWRPHRPHNLTSHWPTDYTADILPVQCHSHNDYWRPIPLKSAIKAGCTGVEADVWFLPERSTDELFVGHSKSSLTPERTFRSLYVSPLIEILERQNPITPFHPDLDSPRNGVFDTDQTQTLVLLVDFKTDGQELWSHVSGQLEPLRRKQYLTYFNGTDTIAGPITVVATGNAPFNKVVESTQHRDIFFDAPLDLMANLASGHKNEHTKPPISDYLEDKTSGTTAGNQGQGYSGAAPKNAAVYTTANSYYASVSFGSSIGHALPFLTRTQKDRIRQQIEGAHKHGLKVRYWETPAWPIGLRNYIWRVLVEEGVDYLNVDDLKGATRGDWGRPRRRHSWGLGDWSIWSRR